MTGKPLSYQQLSELVEKESDLLLDTLGLSEALFVVPTDGEGLRIRVSAIAAECSSETKTVKLELSNKEPVDVEFEIVDDYKPIKPQPISEKTDEDQ
jgi:hypothetical protein